MKKTFFALCLLLLLAACDHGFEWGEGIHYSLYPESAVTSRTFRNVSYGRPRDGYYYLNYYDFGDQPYRRGY